MNDLEIIKKLEEILLIELKKIQNISMPQKGYTVRREKVVGLALCNCKIANLELIVPLLEKLEDLSILYQNEKEI